MGFAVLSLFLERVREAVERQRIHETDSKQSSVRCLSCSPRGQVSKISSTQMRSTVIPSPLMSGGQKITRVRSSATCTRVTEVEPRTKLLGKLLVLPPHTPCDTVPCAEARAHCLLPNSFLWAEEASILESHLAQNWLREHPKLIPLCPKWAFLLSLGATQNSHEVA